MKLKSYSKSKTASSFIFSCAIIGACTLVFSIATQSVMAADFKKVDSVSTRYSSTASISKQVDSPEGYTKADYNVLDNSLEFFKDKKPTIKDLSKESAAELGAQAIWTVFNADLSGSTIFMGYNPAGDTFPRDIWCGDIQLNSNNNADGPTFFFSLDAVTGEVFTVSSTRTLPVTVPLGLDMELAENPQEYLNLAANAAKKYNLIDGEVSSTEYNSQGYIINDPTITINIYGKNGKQAQVAFSRYDQKLLGISFDTEIQIREAALKKLLSETERSIENKIENDKATGKSSNSNGLVAL